MNQELQVVNTDTGEVVEGDYKELCVARPPDEVLDQARSVALALKQRIDNKAKPVKFNGETYLEFEDWQVLANFYGITVKVTETKYVEYGTSKGFEAKAVAIKIGSGQEISGAEAMCLNDEPNWSRKPLFQLKSMAQTRACSKALRNILAWVVVLAGYKPTPAEEMVVPAQPATVLPRTPQKNNVPVYDYNTGEVIAELPQANLPEEVPHTVETNTRSEGRCTFGKNKGMLWSEMNGKQLRWYRDMFMENINDPTKEKYISSNKKNLQEVLDALEAK